MGLLLVNGCSKMSDVSPSTEFTNPVGGVSVTNGRLVFADQKTFDAISNDVSGMDGDKLSAWTKGNRFYSLRDAALSELPNLERLIAQDKAPAYSLVTRFGFPSFYTAIINPLGEYQIGSKIYWFHDGFKHEVSSETELKAIKLNPASSAVKYRTASQEYGAPASTTINGSATTINGSATSSNLTTQTIGTNDRYTKVYNRFGDPGSRRRFIFATYVYTEELARTDNNATQNWRTYLHLRMKNEYYSFGSAKWYEAYESYYVYYRLDNCTARAYVNNFSGQEYIFPPYQNQFDNGGGQDTNAANGGVFTVPITGFVNISNDATYGSASIYDVVWTFELDGQLLSSIRGDGNSTYTVVAGPGTIMGGHLW